jgi:NNP family nitrate/nitrite transporter-like MFS transporter
MKITKAFPFPLTPLLMLLAIFYLSFVARIILAPLLPLIEKDLGIGHGEAGSFFLFIASGYAVGLFLSGFVSAWLNHRRTILLTALMVGAAVLIVSGSTSIAGMRTGLVLAGVFAGFYIPSGIATLTNLTAREHWGKVMAIHELAPNLAFITAPMLSEALLKFFPWRGALAVLGVCSILMGGLFAFAGPGNERGEAPRLQSIQKIVVTPSFWLMVAFFSVSIGSSMGLYAMMPLFLVSEIGFERGWANTLIGLSRVFGIVVLFSSGWITDRWGPQKAMGIFLGTTGFFTLLLGLLPGLVATPLLLFLQASSAVCLFPVGFTALSLLFPPPLRSTAVSLVMFIGFLLGGGAIPPAIGYWAEAFSFSSGFFFLGLLFLSILPVFLRLRSHLRPSA